MRKQRQSNFLLLWIPYLIIRQNNHGFVTFLGYVWHATANLFFKIYFYHVRQTKKYLINQLFEKLLRLEF